MAAYWPDLLSATTRIYYYQQRLVKSESKESDYQRMKLACWLPRIIYSTKWSLTKLWNFSPGRQAVPGQGAGPGTHWSTGESWNVAGLELRGHTTTTTTTSHTSLLARLLLSGSSESQYVVRGLWAVSPLLSPHPTHWQHWLYVVLCPSISSREKLTDCLFILVLLIVNRRKQLLVFINFVDMTGIWTNIFLYER